MSSESPQFVPPGIEQVLEESLGGDDTLRNKRFSDRFRSLIRRLRGRVERRTFVAMIEHFPDRAAVVDLNGSLVAGNRRWKTSFGVPERARRQKRRHDWDLPVFFEPAFRAAVCGKEVRGSLERWRRTPDAVEQLLNWEVKPIRSQSGIILAVLLRCTDAQPSVTRRASAVIQPDVLSGVLSLLPHGVYWKDREGRYLGCNTEYARLVGLRSAIDIRGLTDQQLPCRRLQSTNSCRDENQVMERNEPLLRVIQRWSADGRTERIFESSLAPLHDRDGNVAGVLGAQVDITEQWNSRNGTTVENALLSDAVEAMTAAMVVYDNAGRMVFCNSAYPALYEIDPASIHVGMSYREVLLEFSRQHPEELGGLEVDAWIEERLKTHFVESDGFEVTMLGKTIRVHSYRTAFGLVSLRTDVTAEKNLQKEVVESRSRAEEASRSKSEFLANMSHEIRTPLTAILGFTNDLLEGESNSTPLETQQTLRTIRGAGEHLLTVINDILDLSKVEAGKLEIDNDRAVVADILADVEAMCGASAREKSLLFSITAHEGLPSMVSVDARRLKQILLNLIGNAIKFTDTGSVTLDVELSKSAESHDTTFKFTVRDTGLGMSDEQQKQLFVPFFQGNAGVSRRFGGAGLGLAISRRLAELMGGSLILERSVKGEGTSFVLEVPVGLVKAECKQSVSQAGSLDITVPCRVLLAEDGDMNRKLITRILARAGCEVTTAVNGLEALYFLEKGSEDHNPFDILLTDIQMPEMDGLTLVKTLRKRGHDIPVIALTAHAMNGDREAYIAAGCNEYSSKPIDKRHLLGAIQSLLAER